MAAFFYVDIFNSMTIAIAFYMQIIYFKGKILHHEKRTLDYFNFICHGLYTASKFYVSGNSKRRCG